MIFQYVLDFLNGYHVQLLIAEFFFCTLYKPRIKWYFIVLLVLIYCIAPFAIDVSTLQNFELLNISVDYAYVFWFILSVVIVWISFQFPSVKELLFYCISAVLAEHLVFSLSSTIQLLFHIESEVVFSAERVLVLILVYTVFYIFFVRFLKKDNITGVRGGYLIVFATISVFIVYVLSVWTRSNETPTIGAFLFDAICCVMILLIHFGKFEQGKLEKQNEIMLKLLHIEAEKHRVSAENIAFINMKCHDLKYQIAALKNASGNERADSIKELEKAVSIYDLSLKTGNETLDNLLFERSIVWEKYHINFTCIADGSQLDFMLPSDIYSLFGNALDNAIESVRLIDEVDKRNISLNIALKGTYIVINISNYYEHEITLENDLPQTTKSNKELHGFGLRSIKYITQKYNGSISIQYQREIFILTILIPKNTESES